jgi:hypothetical protein
MLLELLAAYMVALLVQGLVEQQDRLELIISQEILMLELEREYLEVYLAVLEKVE